MPADGESESAKPSGKKGFDRIFLSYARDDDEPFVKRLHADLTKAGFDVWFDRASMPSRSLTFHQEIRDAIAGRERLILVVGAKAITSDYVTQEWQFAYFAANKCVNPIIRLDSRDSQGNKVDGYALIPEDLKLLHAEDFRRDAEYDAHLKNLIRQLSETLAPVGKLVAVPELPPGYRAQPERLKALRDLLLLDLQKPVVVTGAVARVGLQGMGGIGKSVLANALAHHPQVQRAFQDGIYWVTLGQQPRLEELQRQLAVALGGDGQFNNRHEGKEQLRQLLADRAVLLILDDVWERDHADSFNVVGARSRILLTTRDAGLVTALAAHENHYRVELPSLAEAQAILAAAADVPPNQLPPEADPIIKECGRLPLALALCGGMVQGGSSWTSVLAALQEHDLEFLSSEHPGEGQHQNAWKAMDISLRVLPEKEQQRFAELAVFGADTDAPDAAVETLWQHTGGLNPRQTEALLAKLIRRSLAQRPAAADGTVQARIELHDLLHHFATGMAIRQLGSIEALHQRLQDAYRRKCVNGWPTGPDDGYFFQQLCRHLLAMGRIDEAVALLSDLLWVEAKCRAGLVFELQNDYRETIAVLPETRAKTTRERECSVRAAKWTCEIIDYARKWSDQRKRLAVAETVTDPEAILPALVPSHTIQTDDEIDAECQRISRSPTRLDRLEAFSKFLDTQCYPLLNHGRRPGFVIQHAFNDAPAGPVHAAAVPLVAALTEPHMLRRWSLAACYNPKNALVLELEGHSYGVGAVSMTPDGRRAISGGNDQTLRIWDLESGRCLRMLKYPVHMITCMDMTPDGCFVVVGSDDVSESEGKKLRIWNLETGECLRVMEDSVTSGSFTCVKLTPDGTRAISGSDDHTLQVWNLETGACLQSLSGHNDAVTSVDMTPDGRRAISGSSDHTVRVWNLETGASVRTLEGHSDWVTSVSGTPDGRRGVSGSSDGTLRVWNLETGACLRTLETQTAGISSVVVMPGCRYAVAGHWDMTIRVWDLETGRCLRILETHAFGMGLTLSVTLDGRRAVSSGSFDNTVRLWNLETGVSFHAVEKLHDSVNSVTVTPDGRRAISASTHVWVTRDGRRAIIIGRNCIGKWDLKTGAGALFRPSSDRSAVANEKDEISVWDLKRGVCLRTVECPTRVLCMDVTPNGRRVVCGDEHGTLMVLDLGTGACLQSMPGHAKYVRKVTVISNGNHAITEDYEDTRRLWDLETGTCLRTENILLDEPVAIRYARLAECCSTRDGRLGVSWTDFTPTLMVWNLKTRKLLCALEGHSHKITSASLTSDGRCVCSGSEDKTVRVWDIESKKCLCVLACGTPISALTLSPNNQHAIVGTKMGSVMIIDLRGFSADHTAPAASLREYLQVKLSSVRHRRWKSW